MEEEEDGGGWVVCVGLIRAAVVYLRADTSFFFCSDNAYLYGANNGCQEREGDVKKKKGARDAWEGSIHKQKQQPETSDKENLDTDPGKKLRRNAPIQTQKTCFCVLHGFSHGFYTIFLDHINKRRYTIPRRIHQKKKKRRANRKTNHDTSVR